MRRIIDVMRIALPEYQERRLFTARLRIVLFIGGWLIYLYFFRHVISQVIPTTVIFGVIFTLSLWIYFNVRRSRLLNFSLVLELFCDLISITTVIYLTGGPYSNYFTMYIFYSLIGGIFYNHYLTAFMAASSVVTYGLFLLLCSWGIIPPLILDYGEHFETPSYTPFAHYLFTLIFLGLGIYTVKIASFFSLRRERMLEQRNKELTALNRMSSIIRSVVALKEVISQVLSAIVEGLGFETALLLTIDRESKSVKLHSLRLHPRVEDVENILGGRLGEISIPMGEAMLKGFNTLVESRAMHWLNFNDFMTQFGFASDKSKRIDELLGYKSIVAVPLVAGQKVVGAMVGFCMKKDIEKNLFDTMEGFANQAALSLEAAALIERLRKMNENLERANRVKSEFLATMSHELRTPLTAIIGYSELLIEGMMGDISQEQKESLQDILHNGEELLELINNLLDLTRIDSGKMPLEERPFDLTDLIERLHRRLMPLLQNKGQKFEMDIPADFPPITGDERKIQQVIMNLLSNANKFTPDGGTIRVSANRYEDVSKAPWYERVKKLDCYANGGAEIVVSDNGIGLEKDELENIFNMFHQVESGVTRSYKGTGLGLALARRMVELHNGKIWAESKQGQGSQFYVVLPVVKGV
ncbi:MAG: HAMP domain-containing sensor histidine kinase [Pseudomonadota bacterium]